VTITFGYVRLTPFLTSCSLVGKQPRRDQLVEGEAGWQPARPRAAGAFGLG
jgi:hypothetical protein